MKKKKLIFFTGARSEYGIIKSLLATLEEDNYFDISLYVAGLHFLENFGNTIDEIKSNGFKIEREINVFSKDREPNEIEFSDIIKHVANYLKEDQPDAFFITGDRIESYAATIGAHFAKTPIIHIGGGNITQGANDNIYRYNMTNFADFHLSTNENNYNRLKEIRIIDNENIFFTGSFAIDAIFKFKENAKPVTQYVPTLEGNDFCLMTFHSATKTQENISSVMDFSIKNIINRGIDILLTYPNNDEGYQEIIATIKKWENNKHVHVKKHLGALGYYAALNDSNFIIGNSSSGLIEAPYFHKTVINIGTRQEGRDCDNGVRTVKCSTTDVKIALDDLFNNDFENQKNNNLFGNGSAVKTTINILKKIV